MKRFNIILSLMLLIGALSAQDTIVCKERSRIVLEGLMNDQFDKQQEFYATALLDALPEQGLKGTWQQLIAGSGKFIEASEFKCTPFEEYLLVNCALNFENKSYDFKLTYSKDNELGGIFFAPLRRAKVYDLADNASFFETDIVIPSEVDLPGILTMPKGKVNVPVVILVHGSGPQDRDATIGPNKPFKDIAHYLANKGIASIRYDKRSYVGKGLNPKTLTVQEVVIDDVLAAVQFVKTLEGINTNIFVLGHSLGAHLTPRILAADASIKGGIMLAGNARPLQDLILEQSHHLAGEINVEKQAELDYLKMLCKNADKAHCRWKTFESKELPLNVPQSFYADLNKYNALKTAKKLSQPLFIAQGVRDYQVTMEDFNLWKKKLKKKSNVQLKTYASLNHLLMSGEGASYPIEYEVQSNVSEELLSDIAQWILQQR